MRTELIQPTDRPTQFLQSIVGNKEVVKQLITNGGNENALIIENAKTQIHNFNPQEKTSLLKGIFKTLSDDGEEWNQDQRDAGLELLRLVEFKEFKPEDLQTTVNHYKEALSLLHEDSDYLGEIYALLEAGKIIAPHISQVSDKGRISRAWNRICSFFLDKQDEHNYIANNVDQIQRLMPTKNSELDNNVRMLVEQRVIDQDIATELEVPVQEVERSVRRLRKKGILSYRKNGRRRGQTNENEELSKQVKDFRNAGMGNTEIAIKLKISLTKVANIARELIEREEILKIRNSGPKKKV